MKALTDRLNRLALTFAMPPDLSWVFGRLGLKPLRMRVRLNCLMQSGKLCLTLPIHFFQAVALLPVIPHWLGCCWNRNRCRGTIQVIQILARRQDFANEIGSVCAFPKFADGQRKLFLLGVALELNCE